MLVIMTKTCFKLLSHNQWHFISNCKIPSVAWIREAKFPSWRLMFVWCFLVDIVLLYALTGWLDRRGCDWSVAGWLVSAFRIYINTYIYDMLWMPGQFSYHWPKKSGFFSTWLIRTHSGGPTRHSHINMWVPIKEAPDEH